MPIVTVSRGSYHKGKEVALKVAHKLGYGCFSRDQILEASEQFNIPELLFVKSISNAPSAFEKYAVEKKKYTAFIQAALLEHFQKDNIVYHGLAGHFFLKGVSHVLKVRINADMEDRVRDEMARSKFSREEALELLQKEDDEGREWTLSLYNIDTSDASLYDLVIRIGKITVEDAVETICDKVKRPQFQATPESRKELDDLVRASRVVLELCR